MATGASSTMKAAAFNAYGPPEALHTVEWTRPHAGGDRVLVRVVCASVNPIDCKVCHWVPGFEECTQAAGNAQGPAPQLPSPGTRAVVLLHRSHGGLCARGLVCPTWPSCAVLRGHCSRRPCVQVRQGQAFPFSPLTTLPKVGLPVSLTAAFDYAARRAKFAALPSCRARRRQ